MQKYLIKDAFTSEIFSMPRRGKMQHFENDDCTSRCNTLIIFTLSCNDSANVFIDTNNALYVNQNMDCNMTYYHT